MFTAVFNFVDAGRNRPVVSMREPVLPSRQILVGIVRLLSISSNTYIHGKLHGIQKFTFRKSRRREIYVEYSRTPLSRMTKIHRNLSGTARFRDSGGVAV